MLPEVGAANLRIAANLAHAATGNDPAVDEDGNAIGERKDRIHVVLDEQDGRFVPQLIQQPREALRTFRAHSSHRFIEQERSWAKSQRDRDFEPAAFAMR